MPRILSGNILEERPFSRQLVACDPSGLKTLTINIQPNQGTVLLGSFMTLSGDRALTTGQAAGVLSMTINTDSLEAATAAAVYTGGRFSWLVITRANPDIIFDELTVADLVAKGLTFEAVAGVPSHRWISLPY